MSAHLEAGDRNIRLGGFNVTRSRLKASFGSMNISHPENTSNVNTVIVKQAARGLASLIGKYSKDPSWEEFPAFLDEYRRQIDELSRD